MTRYLSDKYQMRIKLTFQNTLYILIELIDHPVIARWYDTYKQAVEETDNFYRLESVNNRFTTNVPDTGIINAEWHSIKTTLATIRSMNYKIPFEISDSFDFKQTTLNQLHRFFTYNAHLAHFKEFVDDHCVNKHDPDFDYQKFLPMNQWLVLIDRINQSVHTLEHFVTTDTKSYLAKHYPLKYLKLVENLNSIDLTKKSYLMRFTESEQQLNYRSLDYSRGPSVTLSESILGKCMLQSFYEEDDPTEFDCTGRMMSLGGFYIDVDGNRQRIYRSDKFRSWLKRHKIYGQPQPLEFQIGHVIDSTVDPSQLDRLRLLNIEFT
jgi:hypothetical protein